MRRPSTSSADAAKRAGWRPALLQKVQQSPAGGCARPKSQREEDLALRRILVAYLFKKLRPGLRATPSSTATAQAIIGQLEKITAWTKAAYDRPNDPGGYPREEEDSRIFGMGG